MLAGCLGAVFMAVQTAPLVIEAASEIVSSTNLNRRPGYPANRSKSELCQIVEYGKIYKEKAKQILRSKGLSCDYKQ